MSLDRRGWLKAAGAGLTSLWLSACDRLNETPGIPEELLPVVPEYLNGRAYTIFGGSSEIQREIIAKMVLGI